MYNSEPNGRGYLTSASVEPTPSSFAEAEGDQVISLRRFFQILRNRLWLIGLITLVLASAASAVSLVQTPMYEASIKILVGQERADSPGRPVENAMGLQQLTQTMAEGLKSRPIAEAVIQQLDLQMSPEAFLGSLTVEPVPETQFMEVRYKDSSPERAQQVANTTGKVFSEQITEVSPTASAITATVWEEAVTPNNPVSPNPMRNTFIALVLGLVLGTVLAFLLELLDDSWDSPEEAQQVTGVPTFGVIPEFEASTGKKVGT